jgi:hypothetical protein
MTQSALVKRSALRFSGFTKPDLLAAARRLFRGRSCGCSSWDVGAADGESGARTRGTTETGGDDGRGASSADIMRFQSAELRRRRLIHTLC